jgi:hypothetical protein
MKTDRAAVEVDRDVQAVLEFMQSNIEVHKLIAVAESIPQLARLPWVMGDNHTSRATTIRIPDQRQ